MKHDGVDVRRTDDVDVLNQLRLLYGARLVPRPWPVSVSDRRQE